MSARDRIDELDLDAAIMRHAAAEQATLIDPLLVTLTAAALTGLLANPASFGSPEAIGSAAAKFALATRAALIEAQKESDHA